MQEFDKWNEVKKETHIKKERKFTIKQREIYWVKIGSNIGDEEYGKGDNFARPVVAVKMLTKGLFLGVPTTTNNRDDDYFQPVVHRDTKGNLKISTAMILQLKVFSVKRVMNRVGMICKDDFKKISEKIGKLVSPI